jgi:hypothetical protein
MAEVITHHDMNNLCQLFTGIFNRSLALFFGLIYRGRVSVTDETEVYEKFHCQIVNIANIN